MDLEHPLGSQFGGVAGNYERGRPGYVPAVVGALMAELGLSPGDPVVDLAAGTGKLTRALLAGGLDVTGVEPSEGMREVLAEIVGPDRVVDGVAEDMPLPDSSQRAVTVADGFHWFDGERALAEIARVLEPGGGLALLATIPAVDRRHLGTRPGNADQRGATGPPVLRRALAGPRSSPPREGGARCARSGSRRTDPRSRRRWPTTCSR